MANGYLASEILASLKRRGMLPDTTEALSATDYYALLNDELNTYIVPLLLSVRERYFLTEQDTTLVANQAAYDIPTRAIGRKLEDVLFKSTSDTSYSPLTEIQPHRAYEYSSTASGSVSAYYLKDDQVVLVPTPTSASGTLRLTYFRRPNRLVAETSANLVSSYNTGTKVLTLAATTVFATSAVVDIVRGTPGFRLIDRSNTLSATSGTSATLTSTPLDTPVAGDYLCNEGESPIPQIPVELIPLLAHRVVVRALEALGDKAGLQVAEATCERIRKSALTLLAPRVEQSHRVIYNRNAPGWGRRRW